MGFYVYVNDVHDKAIVHAGDCRFCNHGTGIHGLARSERRVDDWHGVFATKEEAMADARRTGKTVVQACGVCGP